jgi:hypothetical protein
MPDRAAIMTGRVEVAARGHDMDDKPKVHRLSVAGKPQIRHT